MFLFLLHLLLIGSAGSTIIFEQIPNVTHPCIYTEGSIPSLLCPSCSIKYSSTYSENDERFLSSSLKLSIKSYILGTDDLSGSFGALTFLFHPGGNLGDDDWEPTHAFQSALGDGVMAVTWLDNVARVGRRRSLAELTLALQTIRFQSRGRNPTEKGVNMKRIIEISVEDVDGTSATAQAFVQINGRNDNPFFPSAEKQQRKPLFVSAVEANLDSGPSIPVRLYPQGSVTLDDVDDANATKATVCFQQPAATLIETRKILILNNSSNNTTNSSSSSSLSSLFRIEYIYPGRIHEDVLTFSPPLSILPLISHTWDDAAGCLTLSGNASFTSYLIAISNVFYTNTNDRGNPLLQTRRVELNVWDRRASEPLSSPRMTLISAVSHVNISAINNAPSIRVPNNSHLLVKDFFAGGEAVVLFPLLNITDVDDEFLSSAEAVIADKYARGEDELFFEAVDFAGAVSGEAVFLDEDGDDGDYDDQQTNDNGELTPTLIKQGRRNSYKDHQRGNNDINLRMTMSSMLPLSWSWNASSGIMKLIGYASRTTYMRLLRSLKYRNVMRTSPALGTRLVSLSLYDCGSNGADVLLKGPSRSNAVNTSIRLLRTNAAPLLNPQSAFSMRMSILSGAVSGTEVTNGIVHAASSGDIDDQNRFVVTGGTGASFFYIESISGIIRAQNDVFYQDTGPNVTLEVTVWDRGDSLGGALDALSFTETYEIFIVNVDARPSLSLSIDGSRDLLSIRAFPRGLMLQSKAARDKYNSLASDAYDSTLYRALIAQQPPLRRLAFVHNVDIELCVDLSSIFSSSSSGGGAETMDHFSFELEWVGKDLYTTMMNIDTSTLPSYSIEGNQSLQSLFSKKEPLSFHFPTLQGSGVSVVDSSSVVKGLRCLSGRPTYGPETRLQEPSPLPLSGPSSTNLTFRILAYIGKVRPIDEEQVLSLDWTVPVDIAGCVLPSARFVPCYNKKNNNSSSSTSSSTSSTYDDVSEAVPTGLFLDNTPCDNDCIDPLGTGVCSNICIILPKGGISDINSYSSTDCNNNDYNSTLHAANPYGRFNPNATVDGYWRGDGVFEALESATCVFPHRILTVNVSLPIQSSSLSSTVSFWDKETQGPILIPVGGLWPLPDQLRNVSADRANLLRGYATLRLGRGAIDDLIRDQFSPTTASASDNTLPSLLGLSDLPLGGEDGGATTSSHSTIKGENNPGVHQVSAAFGLVRVQWPSVTPLPPFLTTSSGPSPALDATLMYKLLPAGITFPISSSPAEFCVYTGNGDETSSSSTSTGVGGSSTAKRYPRLFASYGKKKLTPWAEVITYRSEERTTGLLCALLGSFPGLLAVAWGGVPISSVTIEKGGSAQGSAITQKMTEIRRNDSRSYRLDWLAPSLNIDNRPAFPVAFGARLFFSATTGPYESGRELWSLAAGSTESTAWASMKQSDVWLETSPKSNSGGASSLRESFSILSSSSHFYSSSSSSSSSSSGLSTIPAHLVSDINAPGSPGMDSKPAFLVSYSPLLATTASGGEGSDGREVSYSPLLATTASGGEGSDGREVYLPRLFFAATRAAEGRELFYISNVYGGESGSFGGRAYEAGFSDKEGPQVFDLVPGESSSNPEYLTVFDGNLFFSATYLPPIFTPSVRPKEKNSSSSSSSPSPPLSPRPRRELWVYRDTRGTSQVEQPPDLLGGGRERGRWDGSDAEIDSGYIYSGYTNASFLTVCGPRLGFVDAYGAPSASNEEDSGALLFFAASSLTGRGGGVQQLQRNDTGNELWALRKSSNTPFLVADLNPGSGSSFPANLFCWNGKLLFTAITPALGRELYVIQIPFVNTKAENNNQFTSSSQSESPPVLAVELVLDLFPGSGSSFIDEGGVSSSSSPSSSSSFSYLSNGRIFAGYRDQLFFSATDGVKGTELWSLVLPTTITSTATKITPSTAYPYPPFISNVHLVSDIIEGPGSSSPLSLLTYHGRLYFSCLFPIVGREMCVFDGEGVVLAADINTAGDSSPAWLTVFNDRLIFSADDGMGLGSEMFYIHSDAKASLSCGSNGAKQIGERACAYRITPPIESNPQPNDQFGYAVSIDKGYDDLTAIDKYWIGRSSSSSSSSSTSSSSRDNDNGDYVQENDQHIQIPGLRDAFGNPPSSPSHGSVIVGAPGHDSGIGSVFIYSPRGDDGKAYDPLSALSSTLAHTDAAWEAESSSSINDIESLVTSRELSASSSRGWVNVARLCPTADVDRVINGGFGEAVSIDGQLIAIGAPRSGLLPDNTYAGRVFVSWMSAKGGGGRRRSKSSSSSSSSSSIKTFSLGSKYRWIPPSPLHTPNDVTGDSLLGYSVAAAFEMVVAGAPGARSHPQGAYARTGRAFVWSFDNKNNLGADGDGTWRNPTPLDPPAGVLSEGDRYGCAIAVDAISGVIAVSACRGSGRVFLWSFDTEHSVWVLASPGSTLSCPPPADLVGSSSSEISTATASAAFGTSLSMHNGYLAVGAPGLIERGGRGVAFLFAFLKEKNGRNDKGDASSSSSSKDNRFPFNIQLALRRASLRDRSTLSSLFAASVAVSAPSSSPGPYLLTGALDSSNSGQAGTGSGSAHVFETGGSSSSPPETWLTNSPYSESAALVQSAALAPLEAAAGDNFGAAVAAAGDIAVVGSPGDDASSGSVWITACVSSSLSHRSTCSLEEGFYEVIGCLAGRASVCAKCSTGPCEEGFYESAMCSTRRDRVCSRCSTACPNDFVETTPCSPSSDRVCSSKIGSKREKTPRRGKGCVQEGIECNE